jgi:hypothetical protein
MKSYSYSDARQHLAVLLEQAQRDGAVRIRRRDGRTFVILPEQSATSPLDVDGVDIPITADEIVAFVHEGRRKTSS